MIFLRKKQCDVTNFDVKKWQKYLFLQFSTELNQQAVACKNYLILLSFDTYC